MAFELGFEGQMGTEQGTSFNCLGGYVSCFGHQGRIELRLEKQFRAKALEFLFFIPGFLKMYTYCPPVICKMTLGGSQMDIFINKFILSES